MKKILIIGAGISGLYLANIINKHSEFDYKIIEKREYLDFTEGYGIQLSNNSIKLLNKIGFKNLSASELNFPSKVIFFQANNPNKVCEINLGQFNDDQNRYSTLKRSTLLDFLYKNIPKEKIRFGSSIIKYDHLNNCIYLSDNTEEKFDYLIIADGVFSQSKSLVSTDNIQPKFNNSIALRAKINGYETKNISIFMGPNFHYVIYPVNQNNEYNFVAIIKKEINQIDLNKNQIFKSEKFISSLINDLKKNSVNKFNNLTDIKVFPVFVSTSFSQINQNNIYLSGDALFAFSPSFAQGASQSIETANDIFECLCTGNSNLYKKRIDKISTVNLRSKINHFAFQLSSPVIIFFRNLILRYLSKNKKFLENYLGKIYRN